MIKINMIRHGETFGNTLGRYIGKTDEPLLESEEDRLAVYSFPRMDMVYSSPRKRCIQTAAILFPGQEIRVIPELEECDFGEFENKNYQELDDNPHYQEWIESGGSMAFPGGESRLDFQERCVRGFDRVAEECIREGFDEIALVVHGGTIMAILERYGLPKAGYYDWQVRNGEGFRIRFSPENFAEGKKELIVDGRIVRAGEEEEPSEV